MGCELGETVAQDPITAVAVWIAEAGTTEPNNPNAAALATVGPDGTPSCRIVLVKEVAPEGLVFYTNYGSRKGRELDARPSAALTFHWRSLDRQLRVEGRVERTDPAMSDAYFAGRDRGSRIGAWASRQSEPIAGREALEAAFAETAARFGEGGIPRPVFWGGYRLKPSRIEFWQQGGNRLHDRLAYTRRRGPGWWTETLQP